MNPYDNRDAEIDMVIETIRSAWKQAPELRLGQLIANSLLNSETAALFYTSDSLIMFQVSGYIAECKRWKR
jgi:hypothetical protein